MGERVLPALQEVVGPRQVVEGLEPRRQLLVVEDVDALDRLGAVLPCLADPALGGLAERERRGSGGDQRPVIVTARGLQRAPAELPRAIEVEPVETVERELDRQRDGLRRLAVRQLLPRAGPRRGGARSPRAGSRGSARARRPSGGRGRASTAPRRGAPGRRRERAPAPTRTSVPRPTAPAPRSPARPRSE